MRKISILVFALCGCLHAHNTTTCLYGETGTCRITNGSRTDVQSALDASTAGGYGTLTSGGDPRTDGTFDGDGVYIPAGSYTWTDNVDWNNKNLLLIGAGDGSCSPTSSAHNCSCDGSVDTCINASGGGTSNFLNPTASSTAKMQWRISNIYVSSSQNAGAIMVNSNVNYALIPSTAAYGFRIDHVTFNYPNANVEGIILVVGPVFGLIDNCAFINLGEASICTFPIIPTENDYENTCGDTVQDLCGAYFFSLGYFPGDATKNLVIEDSKFWTSGSGNGTMFDTYYYGGKVIFRYNQIWNGTFYSHWTGAGSINSLWLEAYNNVHDGTNSVTGYPFRLQGGATGIVYNNTYKNWSDATFHVSEDRSSDVLGHGVPGPLNSCNGSSAWDGNAGDTNAPGWPCLGQTGRGNTGITINGSNQQSPSATSYPLYLWNNGTQDACAACADQSSSTCASCTNTFTVSSEAENYIKATAHPNGDVDWSKTATQPSGAGTHTLTYTAATYPHPLQGEGGTPPTITTTTLPDGQVDEAYSQTIAATGDATITWTCCAAGALPGGLSLATDGDLTGTPTEDGTFNFTVTATNSSGNDTQALELVIDPAPAATVSTEMSGTTAMSGATIQ